MAARQALQRNARHAVRNLRAVPGGKDVGQRGARVRVDNDSARAAELDAGGLGQGVVRHLAGAHDRELGGDASGGGLDVRERSVAAEGRYPFAP